MAAYFSLLGMLLFLGVYLTVPCSASLENFVGLPHITGIHLSPKFLPSGGTAQMELTRRWSCIWLSIHQAKFWCGKPRWFVLWLLLASCDVERCLGPKYIEFSCVVCYKPVVSEGIWCTAYHKWCHHKCAWVSDEDYQRLGNSPDDWFCPACCLPIFTVSLLESPIDMPGCSPSKSSCAIDHRLKILYTNCRSLFTKLDSLCHRLSCCDSPESWLDKDIRNAEIAIPGYQPVRRDRDMAGALSFMLRATFLSLGLNTMILLSYSQLNQPSPS